MNKKNKILNSKILIVLAEFYEDISSHQLENAKLKLPSNLIEIKVIKVQGVFEIPVTISKNIKKYDAFIALGCVIKGETPHFDFISNAATNAIMKLSVDSKKPIGNGIITCLNREQAEARMGRTARAAANAVWDVLEQ